MSAIPGISVQAQMFREDFKSGITDKLLCFAVKL
jgi:hypothetical protein